MGKHIDIQNVTKSYLNSSKKVTKALDDVSLSIDSGDFVVLVGHNGSGKSTLLKIIAGEILGEQGQVVFDGGTTLPRMARVRQLPGDGTFGELTCLENFHIFLLKGRPSFLRIAASKQVQSEALKRLALYRLEDKLHQPINGLSQGQQQLLALELAMARQPELLLLDEHTASLDKDNAKLCMQATERLAKEANTTVVMVTHNMFDAIRYGNVLCVLREGRVSHQFRDAEKSKLSLESLLDYCGFTNQN